MEPSHIVRSFDEELGQIESLLLEMGGLVETGIAESVEALTNADAELCEKVIREDKKVDALEMRIDQMAVQLLAGASTRCRSRAPSTSAGNTVLLRKGRIRRAYSLFQAGPCGAVQRRWFTKVL